MCSKEWAGAREGERYHKKVQLCAGNKYRKLTFSCMGHKKNEREVRLINLKIAITQFTNSHGNLWYGEVAPERKVVNSWKELNMKQVTQKLTFICQERMGKLVENDKIEWRPCKGNVCEYDETTGDQITHRHLRHSGEVGNRRKRYGPLKNVNVKRFDAWATQLATSRNLSDKQPIEELTIGLNGCDNNRVTAAQAFLGHCEEAYRQDRLRNWKLIQYEQQA